MNPAQSRHDESVPLQSQTSTEITFARAASTMMIVVALIFIGYVVFGAALQLVMLLAMVAAMGLGVLNGYGFNHVETQALEAIKQIIPLMLILFAVGALIGAWILAGTVPAIIYAGLSIISPRYFLVTAVVLCMATSVATGTSWGTMGTMGVAMMGVANGLDISPDMTAGAIISGAYFGDKMSPLSDSTNLAPAVSGSELISHIRRMLWTTLPAITLTMLVFLGIGLATTTPQTAGDQLHPINAILEGLTQHFDISWISLLPVVVLLGLLIAKQPAYTSILIGALAGAALAIPLQGASFDISLTALYQGFSIDTGLDSLDALLNRGGISSMYPLAALFFFAVGLGGVLNGTGVVTGVMRPILPWLDSPRRIATATIPIVIVSLMIGASFSFAAVMAGTLLAPLYKRFGIEAKNLSRTIEDTGTVNDPTFPWSTGAVYASGVLGVSTLSYMPFMFFAFFSVALSLLYALTGFTITTRDDPQIRLPWQQRKTSAAKTHDAIASSRRNDPATRTATLATDGLRDGP